MAYCNRSIFITTALCISLTASAKTAEKTPMIKRVGEKTARIHQSQNNHNLKATSPQQRSSFRFPVLQLDPKLRASIISRIKNTGNSTNNYNGNVTMLTAPNAQPSTVNLEMAGIPVLDQGPYGTCATFAATAAIDALYQLAATDRMSPLCSLQLSRTVDDAENDDSGEWNGAYESDILSMISKYGYETMQYQQTSGCGGASTYPTNGNIPGSAMSVNDFVNAPSNKQFTTNNWTSALSIASSTTQLKQRYNNTNYYYYSNIAKQELAAAHRLAISIIVGISSPTYGEALFPWVTDPYTGTAAEATWAVTPETLNMMNYPDTDYLGHEVIIYGYDDNACVNVESADHTTTTQQCGIFRVRNSWGTNAGLGGEYFMTYDFYENLAYTAYALKT